MVTLLCSNAKCNNNSKKTDTAFLDLSFFPATVFQSNCKGLTYRDNAVQAIPVKTSIDQMCTCYSVSNCKCYWIQETDTASLGRGVYPGFHEKKNASIYT